jgi:hypothetical protein
VEQANDGASGLIPGLDRLLRSEQIHAALFAAEIVCRVFRKPDQTDPPGAHDQSLGTLLVDVPGLVQ